MDFMAMPTDSLFANASLPTGTFMNSIPSTILASTPTPTFTSTPTATANFPPAPAPTPLARISEAPPQAILTAPCSDRRATMLTPPNSTP